MVSEKKNHYDSLDILRGMAIFMVVCGHLIDNKDILFRYLNNLHLPLFFVISGYLLSRSLSRHSCEYVFKKKIFHLFIPFLSWSTVALILKAIILMQSNEFSIKKIYMIFLDVIIYANSAWFLLTLFFGSCLLILYEKLKGKRYLFWIFIFFIYFFLPNNILKFGKLKIMFPIFFIGFWLEKKSGEYWLKNIYLKIGGIIFSIFFLTSLYFIYDKKMYIAFTEFNIPLFSKDDFWYLYYWFIQFLGLFFSVYILYPFFRKLYLSKFFKIAGVYSMDIYMQHLFFVNYVIKIHNDGIISKHFTIILYATTITIFCIFISKYILHKILFYRFFMLGQENSSVIKNV